MAGCMQHAAPLVLGKTGILAAVEDQQVRLNLPIINKKVRFAVPVWFPGGTTPRPA